MACFTIVINKQQKGTNTQPYGCNALITTVKSFIVQVPESLSRFGHFYGCPLADAEKLSGCYGQNKLECFYAFC